MLLALWSAHWTDEPISRPKGGRIRVRPSPEYERQSSRDFLKDHLDDIQQEEECLILLLIS